MNKATELDYFLVKRIKENNDDSSKLKLFYKYKYLVKGMYNESLYWLKSYISEEDFINESYFAFIKALDYCDLTKVYSPEKWLFLGCFKDWLSNTIRLINEKEMRISYVNEDIFNIESFTSTVNRENNKTLNDIHVDKFYQSLNDKEKIIFFYRYNYGKEDYSIRRLAEMLGCSHQWVSIMNKKIIKKWKHYTS